jgi:hypothetical protein
MKESAHLKRVAPVLQFKVFISSPSGMDADKAIVVDEIRLLSEDAGLIDAPKLSVAAWPADIAAGAGSYGQAVINRQTCHHDILICLVGTRMGTPTPRANSGTEEEFDVAIDATLGGHPVQILLFFSNMLVRPQSLDPHQLLLVRTFREKASRLGVLYQTYDDLEQLRHLFRVSLREAYRTLSDDSASGRYSPRREALVLDPPPQVIRLPDVSLMSQKLRPQHAPQGASSYPIPLAEYRRKTIRLTWTVETSSSYFRFGFKYYDSREPLFSAGSIQTVGQNILFHIGKNMDSPTWFATAYRSGYRLGSNLPLPETKGRSAANFTLDISAANLVTFSMDGATLNELFFPIDGIPIIALMGWGDEYDFHCEIRNLILHVLPRDGVAS